MKLKRVAQGIGLGLASGFLATLVTAPKSGAEVRSSLKLTAQSVKAKTDDVKTHALLLKDSVTTFTDVSKNNIPGIVNDVKTSVTTFTEGIKPVAANLQKHLGDLQGTVQELQQNAAEFKKDNKKTSEPAS